ncbi:MAG: PDZ domain-containing protein [Hymenobacter sp.]
MVFDAGLELPARLSSTTRISTAPTGRRSTRTSRPTSPASRTPDEARRLTNLMIGELNASHSGMGPAPAPPGTVAPATGRLGLRFDAAEYEQNGRLRLTSVLPLGAAALAGLKPGDVLLAVNGHADFGHHQPR